MARDLKGKNMTDAEYEMTFGQYIRDVKHEPVTLMQNGSISYSDPKREAVETKYHDSWESKRAQYRLAKKQAAISDSLEAIKAAGYKAHLMNYENACIQAISKHGVKVAYYATSGTIAGYYGTDIMGLDCLIDLLGRK